MRIAHFVIGRCNPDSANGIDKTVYYLSKAQAALGHDVLISSLTDKPPIPVPGAQVRTYPPNRIGSGIRVPVLRALLHSPLSVPRRLTDELCAWRPDIFHLHFVHMPQNLMVAARLKRDGIPYCVTIHGGLSPVAQRRNRWIKLVFKLLFERRYLERAAFLHAVSEQDVQGLSAYGIDNITTVVPNGVDIAAFSEPHHGCGPRDLLPALAETRIFLFIGRLDPEQKGLDLLLRAFARVGAQNAALVLAGPDWRGNRSALERTAAELGIAGNVHFTGPVFGADKLAFLEQADVFVHPSRWEAGVPFSVLEALAMRKPCLFTPGADAAGILARAHAGVCVEPEIASIAAGLSRLLAMDSSALHALGECARSLVETEFGWEPIAHKIIAAYRAYAA